MSVSSSKRKNKNVSASDEEEEDDGSLVKKPRVRRRVVLDNESNIPQDQTTKPKSFHLIDDPKDVPLEITEDGNVDPTLTPIPPQILWRDFLLKDLRVKKMNLALFLTSHLLQRFLCVPLLLLLLLMLLFLMIKLALLVGEA